MWHFGRKDFNPCRIDFFRSFQTFTNKMDNWNQKNVNMNWLNQPERSWSLSISPWDYFMHLGLHFHFEDMNHFRWSNIGNYFGKCQITLAFNNNDLLSFSCHVLLARHIRNQPYSIDSSLTELESYFKILM